MTASLSGYAERADYSHLQKTTGQCVAHRNLLSEVQFSPNNRPLTFQCNTRLFRKQNQPSLRHLSASSLATWADVVAFETPSKTKSRRKNYPRDKYKGSSVNTSIFF